MKTNKFIGIAAAGFLTIGIASNVVTTQYEVKQIERHFKQLENRIAQSVAIEKQTANALVTELRKQNAVTEGFIINAIDDDGSVHGESVRGTGEGIYYPISFINEYVQDIKVGDEIEITWPKDSYDNEDWMNIKNISKVL